MLKRAAARLLRPIRRRERSRRPVDTAWRDAIPGEVTFWDRWLRTHGSEWPADYDARLDPERLLQPEIVSAISAPSGATVRILDCGAGAVTWLGKRASDWTVDITAVDVLADDYNKSLDDVGIRPVVRTQSCETERLREKFAADTFDCVFARNTIDHSYDPLRAIGEMIETAKPGGAIVLVHRRNEAEEEDYHGLHQWNLMIDGTDLILWRHGVRSSVGREFASVAAVERTWSADNWEWVVIRKRQSAGE